MILPIGFSQGTKTPHGILTNLSFFFVAEKESNRKCLGSISTQRRTQDW